MSRFPNVPSFLTARSRPRAIAPLLLAMLALAAPGAASAAIPASAKIVKVVAPTNAMSAPEGGTKVHTLKPTEEWGGPTQLRVKATKLLADGSKAYQVFLSKRPNGSTGWVSDERVVELSTPYFIVIDVSDRKVIVFKGGKAVRTRSAVVGAASTPTPTGEFFVSEVIKRANPKEFSGSWVLTFAYSNVLEQFAGGPGRVAMHGRGTASLATPLGTAASHGCVRLDNADISWIAARVPEGTPVRVRR